MDFLEKNDVIDIFKVIHKNILDHKDFLIKLDSEIGDGDIGLTMEAGFHKICENVHTLENENDLGVFIKKLGFAMAGAVPSTMGTLMATAIMKAGDAVRGKDKLTVEDLPIMLSQGIAGMEQRAKGRRGDKTILDALYPALEEIQQALEKNGNFKIVSQAAFAGAKRGVAETKTMKSKLGKAAVFGENSIGKQDPGATVAEIIFEAIVIFFENKND